MQNYYKNQFNQGMTLVEMLVVIGIYTILITVVTGSIANIYQNHSYALIQTEEINNARIGMTQWTRDTKEMTVAEDGTFPLAVIDEHIFGYYSDTDQDDSIEYVEYVLSSTTLTKYTYGAVGTPAVYDLVTPESEKVLSLYVQNSNQSTSTFMYYDNAGNALSSTSPVIDVKYIRAQVIVNIDTNKSVGFTLKSSVAPRNLKDNL